MGMFVTVEVDNSIELPHFPERIDRTDMRWQSKEGLDRYGLPYCVTEDGKLEQKQQEHREKTDEEKQSEAEKWGFDSWDEYKNSYEEAEGLYPDHINREDYDEEPPVIPRNKVVENEFWHDVNHHGTFEIHQMLRENPQSTEPLLDGETGVEVPADHELDVFLNYEITFDRGDLEEIKFMGDPLFRQQETIELLEEFDRKG